MNDLAGLLIKQYRGLINLELKDLNKVNIFVGPNNCGKTSVLEAISLGIPFNINNSKNLLDVLISRYHGVNFDAFKSIFPLKTKIKDGISICLTLNEAKEELIGTLITSEENIGIDKLGRSNSKFSLDFTYTYVKDIKNNNEKKQDLLRLELKENGNMYSVDWKKQRDNQIETVIPYNYLSFSRFDIAERLLENVDILLGKNQRKDLIEALRIFDDSIENFEVIGKERMIKLFSTKFDRPLSLYDYGNGMYKAFFIITAALLSRNGVLLVDEIEAGIHTGALSNFISKLLSVCKLNDVQLFMTTHSLEAIDTILYDCQKDDYIKDIAIYHIKNTEEKTIAKRYSGERLIRLRDNVGFDVR